MECNGKRIQSRVASKCGCSFQWQFFFVSIVAFCLLVCTASFLEIFKFLAEMIGFV